MNFPSTKNFSLSSTGNEIFLMNIYTYVTYVCMWSIANFLCFVFLDFLPCILNWGCATITNTVPAVSCEKFDFFICFLTRNGCCIWSNYTHTETLTTARGRRARRRTRREERVKPTQGRRKMKNILLWNLSQLLRFIFVLLLFCIQLFWFWFGSCGFLPKRRWIFK